VDGERGILDSLDYLGRGLRRFGFGYGCKFEPFYLHPEAGVVRFQVSHVAAEEHGVVTGTEICTKLKEARAHTD
jgi:hypothetical protein